MVNGLTTTDRYPYSARGELGDKSVVRTPTPRDTRWVNYVQDSVKATVDAFTGEINLYKWKGEPVVDTWADIYPDLFKDRRTRCRSGSIEQVQYPPQLMHLQFDDVYIYTHMKDPLTFFSQEDLFDDGDEVLGPILEARVASRSTSRSSRTTGWRETGGGSPLPQATPPEQFAHVDDLHAGERAQPAVDHHRLPGGPPTTGSSSMLAVPEGRVPSRGPSRPTRRSTRTRSSRSRSASGRGAAWRSSAATRRRCSSTTS